MIDRRENESRAQAERLTNDRLQAESVIRDLLRQLSEREQGAISNAE
jgi:hypothetical protein